MERRQCVAPWNAGSLPATGAKRRGDMLDSQIIAPGSGCRPHAGRLPAFHGATPAGVQYAAKKSRTLTVSAS